MKVRLLVFLLVCLGVFVRVDSVHSQAFNTFNGRNHPELKWMEVQSEHFRIMYPEHLSGIETQAISVAESTYVALSKGLGVEFDRKIKIYLSDEDEIVNGAALPMNGSYTFIWVGLNSFSEVFSSDKKWLRKVMSHELAHLFHFEAVRTNMGTWGFVFGEPGGRDVIEGYAQYATEVWDAQRGDRWLRQAIFDDKPNFNDGLTPYNGRLVYSAGYSKMLFWSDQYGDSTIAQSFAYRDTLIGKWLTPNVYKGFKKATGETWGRFENRWLKHMNVYYNTLASQMDRTDSLHGKRIDLGDNLLIFGAKVSGSAKRLITLSYKSVEKPYTQLSLSERDSAEFKIKKSWPIGGSNGDLSWSADENVVFYSKMGRTDNGSLVNDLYQFDIKKEKEKKLSENKRLSYPVFYEFGKVLAVQNINGTGNVVEFDLNSKTIQLITTYSGDTQVFHLDINKEKTKIVYARFDAKGKRFITVKNLKTGEEIDFTDGATDDRNPRFSADGKQVAFSSLRDKVPNIFVLDIETGIIKRATHVFTGADLLDWSPNLDKQSGRWIVQSSESKVYEHLLSIADTLRKEERSINLPDAYLSWIHAGPKHVIGGQIQPNPNLIQSRAVYSPLKNISHFVSFGYPYYDEKRGDYGIQGFSMWNEPLGKHTVFTTGNISFTDAKEMYGLFNYANKTQSFTWSFDAYRFPGAIQFYSDNWLTSMLSGFSLGLSKDVDWISKPYSGARYMFTSRAFKWEALTSSVYKSPKLNFSDRWQHDVIAAFELKHALPYVYNDIHPLKAFGLNISLRAGINAEDSWYGDKQEQFVIADVKWYDVRPIYSEITWASYMRAQAQFGKPLPFEAVQLSRYDNITLPVFTEIPISIINTPERVRGYRNFILSNQLVFNSQELRAPLLPSLATSVLGIIRFDKTTAAVFSDVAFANDITFGSVRKSLWQWGLGAEIKNKITFLGVLPIVQALGFAQPYNDLFMNRNQDVYYRIQAVIPF
ncbi:hypothetical protein EP331_04140 [bacterium]|nr:MAG: hypothetical protein EP331_04140 [bacterium]